MKTFAATAALIGFFASGAVAQDAATTGRGDPSPGLEERFERLDANRDGFITWAEAEPSRAAEFKALDVDGDGAISEAEWKGRAMPVQAFDANGDGRVTQAEYVGKHKSMFQSFDADRDGRIGPGEFAEAQSAARDGR
jgi:hypothetical protein